MKHRITRTAGAISLALVTGVALSACSGGGSDSSAKSLTLWDSFTQYDASSPYGKLLSGCEASTGITLERTSDPDLTTKLLQSAASKSTPDLVTMDNPSVAKFADTGLFVDNETSGLKTTDVLPNVLAAGQLDGKTYGSSIGANTLALFYNKDLLDAAGITPPTNWSELSAAATKLSSGDVKGLGFSAAGSEEGTFQFLPFFWGSGASLDDISSDDAVSALTLWTDMVKSGSASQSNVNANQQDVRDQFLAGKLGMMVNGTWQLSALDEAGINYGVVPLPAKDGGAAPSPLGGEFVEVVVSDPAKQKLSAEFAQCMIEPDNLKPWATGQSYIMPYADAAAAQATENPALVPWVEAISVAQGRTSDLGVAYPDTSKALYTAIQEALTGSKSPKAALDDAAASLKK
ncbi:sugar ABC transporter substrate-binding protein [Agreia pratensis]|uniref:Carbohydrate ABC transporter substrate-binding protein, CUT1 family n=1 Tax=Agreia pratensis TaxID=150121 RepID=A0A1X7IZL6_9MICO|nr:sugar ABC transporter substrate-binding protein [Agreia pratensis]MBF4636107.1 sugar ABC transporter substrate-binding protein [Agreia pratensis]SMG20607.1 carbohydrate ABC transporter substrate-binding protein, CUT1 family [Agreia pratensis]